MTNSSEDSHLPLEVASKADSSELWELDFESPDLQIEERWQIKLTPSAAQAVEKLQQEDPSRVGQSLRVYIEGKGCDGFYYGVTFDEMRESDVVLKGQNIGVVVDRESFRFLAGSTVEWVDDERGRGFLVDNPNHKKYRGKFYKRTLWTERLLKSKPIA